MLLTAVYAGLLAMVFLVLSVRVIGARRAARVSIGDGGEKNLLRRMRVHGNFAEYAPFTLLLMFLAETQGAPVSVLHGIGIMLLIGRLLHAIGLGSDPENFRLRVGGMALTFTALGLGAIVNLAAFLYA